MQNFFRFTFILLISASASAQLIPTGIIVPTSSVFCTDAPLTFSSVISGSPTSYTWDVTPAKGTAFLSARNSPTVSISFSNALTYTISFTLADANQKSSSSYILSIAKQAKASFNASLLNAGYPNQLVLTNYSSNSIKNYWQFSDVSTIDSSINTVKDYSQGGSYTVTLIAKGKQGCDGISTYAFRISDSSGVTLPNIFTPNNDDVNDVYRPITKGIYQLKAYVYNRYGLLMASWDKVNGFWDGTTGSGEPCSMGEYFIVVEARGFDGRSYKLNGEITLIR